MCVWVNASNASKCRVVSRWIGNITHTRRAACSVGSADGQTAVTENKNYYYVLGNIVSFAQAWVTHPSVDFPMTTECSACVCLHPMATALCVLNLDTFSRSLYLFLLISFDRTFLFGQWHRCGCVWHVSVPSFHSIKWIVADGHALMSWACQRGVIGSGWHCECDVRNAHAICVGD